MSTDDTLAEPVEPGRRAGTAVSLDRGEGAGSALRTQQKNASPRGLRGKQS